MAKEVFQIHGVDEHGKLLFNRQLKRAQVTAFFTKLPPCLISMEACASSHYWASTLMSLGHTVKLMAPQFVKPYVKTNKHDAADAGAICEAVTRPNMRFVPIKASEQQAVLALHRIRQGFIKQRTAEANQIRGLLGEFGIIIPQGITQILRKLPDILEDADNRLPALLRQQLSLLQDYLDHLFKITATLDKQIEQCHQHFNALQLVNTHQVSYKPFHNQFRKESFALFMKALVERAIALRIDPQLKAASLGAFKQVLLHDGTESPQLF